MIETSLFESEHLRLSSVDVDKDAPIESLWTYDLNYARHIDRSLARPRTMFEMKRYYQTLQKGQEKNELVHFAVRRRADDRLVGFWRLDGIEWANGVAHLQMAIGDVQQRCYEAELLMLALRYAFDELNLYRLQAWVPEHDRTAQTLYVEQGGFTLEGRRRLADFYAGRLWDVLMYGLLRPEWQASRVEVTA